MCVISLATRVRLGSCGGADQKIYVTNPCFRTISVKLRSRCMSACDNIGSTHLYGDFNSVTHPDFTPAWPLVNHGCGRFAGREDSAGPLTTFYLPCRRLKGHIWTEAFGSAGVPMQVRNWPIKNRAARGAVSQVWWQRLPVPTAVRQGAIFLLDLFHGCWRSKYLAKAYYHYKLIHWYWYNSITEATLQDWYRRDINSIDIIVIFLVSACKMKETWFWYHCVML